MKVSPAFTVLEAVRLPNHRRTGVAAESNSSTPVTVQAGMFVYVRPTFEEIEPEAAAAKVIDWRA